MSLLTSAAAGLVSRADEADLDGVFGNDPVWVVLLKALLIFVTQEHKAPAVVEAIVDAARSGNESGDGIVWTTPVASVMHNRTGRALEEVEVAA